MFRTGAGLLSSLSLLSACGGSGDAPSSDTTAASGAVMAVSSAALVGEANGMSTPESVRYDAELDVFYVSNIGGNPSQKDGNGFIAVVRADSTSSVTRLVEGGKNGATLNAPKGLALVGDTLWVADIDAVRGFNRRTGAPVATIDLTAQNAAFLNDVAAGPDGAIYVTDTGIRFDASGQMSESGTDRVFRITGRTVSEVASGDSLSGPNGITWDAANNQWILAPFGGMDVQALKEGAAAPTRLASGPGQYDGVEVMADGRILVTSWADSAVHIVSNGTMAKLISGVSAPADIGLDTKRGVVAVPRFNDNKVEFYHLH